MQTLPTFAKNLGTKRAIKSLSQLGCVLLFAGFALATPPAKDAASSPANYTVRIEAPESDVAAAVEQVTQDQIIHGTYSYEKERILYGAHSAASAKVFGTWNGQGKVFYKVATNVLAPRFFKNTGDIGTVSIRYVVQPADANATVLRIDAVFVDARDVHHPSLGDVEASEYAAIQQHLRTIQGKREELEAKNAKGTSYTATPAAPASPQPAASTPATDFGAMPSEIVTVPAMEKHIAALRHEVELRVKVDGAQLKSAPYHSAATLESLPPQSEVLIVVLTPYWYGVETEDGHRGWVHHSQLEPLP